ncbi:hypothetical protein GCM10010193_24390 [Kitasatospora atroaurantiaca]|uniref:Uncharacterized protein n=1 Tax=Kitasatospora atroaurantiaca TaxID=285545 RepID=A0A561F0V8_9ACTN|nr:hypothetical protein [Kitasatospora atroaurantiaca]TWE21489.1 hypothetical protein FB465_6672 [Kitasatospora atroaurantiaca]
MFRRWWFVRLLRDAGPEQRSPGRRLSKDQQELVLREWEVLRDRLTGFASERVAAAGDIFRAAELRLPPEEEAARRDYLWALEAYEAAGKLLDEASDLPDLTAAVVLAERAVERLAAAHAAHAGVRPGPPVVRCFYNPLHAPVPPTPTRSPKRERQRRRLGAREAAADRRPACTACRRAILAGQTPDVLPALLPAGAAGRKSPRVLVPYYAVPQQWSPWAATGCGAYDDRAPALVLRGEHRRRV